MPRHAERRRSAYSAQQLFDLVIDVEKYPEFLPWCLGAAITARHEGGFEADLVIGYRVLRADYRSRITCERPSRVDVELVRGPFRHLTNQWLFCDLRDGNSEITFVVDFEFRSPVFSKAMTPLFGTVVQRMVREFERRAETLYGRAIEIRDPADPGLPPGG